MTNLLQMMNPMNLASTVLEGVGKAMNQAMQAMQHGMQCMAKLAQGDLMGAMSEFNQGCNSAMQAMGGMGQLPGLQMNPMAMMQQLTGQGGGGDCGSGGNQGSGQMLDSLSSPFQLMANMAQTMANDVQQMAQDMGQMFKA
jgi:hypothetical protein